MEDIIFLLLEIFLEAIAHFPLQTEQTHQYDGSGGNILLQCLGYTLIGALLGGVSLLILSRGLLHQPVWQIVNLIVAPLFAAWLAYFFAVKKWPVISRYQVRLRSWRAYCFTLALVLVRYTFVKTV